MTSSWLNGEGPPAPACRRAPSGGEREPRQDVPESSDPLDVIDSGAELRCQRPPPSARGAAVTPPLVRVPLAGLVPPGTRPGADCGAVASPARSGDVVAAVPSPDPAAGTKACSAGGWSSSAGPPACVAASGSCGGGGAGLGVRDARCRAASSWDARPGVPRLPAAGEPWATPSAAILEATAEDAPPFAWGRGGVAGGGAAAAPAVEPARDASAAGRARSVSLGGEAVPADVGAGLVPVAPGAAGGLWLGPPVAAAHAGAAPPQLGAGASSAAVILAPARSVASGLHPPGAPSVLSTANRPAREGGPATGARSTR